MNSLRVHAVLTGGALIIMGIVAGYYIGYNLPLFSNNTGIELGNHLTGYKEVLLGLVITIILDFIVSYTFYKFFAPTDKYLSKISGIIRLVYSVIFSIAAYFLFENLAHQSLTDFQIQQNFYWFQTVWVFGLSLFGIHIILLGVLSKKHGGIPKWLWITTLIAGFSYTIVSILKLIYPGSSSVEAIEMILALPMAIGELSLAFWLLVKGGMKLKVTD